MQRSIEISILEKMFDEDTPIDSREFGGFDQIRDYLLENGMFMPGVAPEHDAGTLTAYLIENKVFVYFDSPEVRFILPMRGLTEELDDRNADEQQSAQNFVEQPSTGSQSIIFAIIAAIFGFIWQLIKPALLPGSGNAGSVLGNYSQSGSNRKQIGNAVDRGGVVYVYDERGHQICGLPGGNGPDDGLKGYTSGTVSIRRGPVLYTYDAQGHQIFAGPASSPHFNR